MCFLPLKSSHYPSPPVPVPELFGKYPTRPVPKSKTPTRQTLLIGRGATIQGPSGHNQNLKILSLGEINPSYQNQLYHTSTIETVRFAQNGYSLWSIPLIFLEETSAW